MHDFRVTIKYSLLISLVWNCVQCRKQDNSSDNIARTCRDMRSNFISNLYIGTSSKCECVCDFRVVSKVKYVNSQYSVILESSDVKQSKAEFQRRIKTAIL